MNRWHRPAVLFSWLVLLAFTGVSVWLNVAAVELHGPATVLARCVHGGLPVTLLVALTLLELSVLAGAHGAAKFTGLLGLVAVAVTTFAGSYAGILNVITSGDPTSPAPLRWSVSAVPDVLMLTATVILVSLRQKRHGTVSVTGPGRLSRIANVIGDRVENRLAPPIPDAAPTPVPPLPDPHIAISERIANEGRTLKSPAEIRALLDAHRATGNISAAAAATGMARNTARAILEDAEQHRNGRPVPIPL